MLPAVAPEAPSAVKGPPVVAVEALSEGKPPPVVDEVTSGWKGFPPEATAGVGSGARDPTEMTAVEAAASCTPCIG